MSEFKETPQSLLRRVLPDIDDLKAEAERFVSTGDRDALVAAWSNFDKINDAMNAVEDYYDAGQPIAITLDLDDPDPA